jgi:hypothetical protein
MTSNKEHSMPGFTALSIADAESIYDPGTRSHWLPLRDALGIGAFGFNAWRADAGAEVIERHDELTEDAGGHEEVYFVVEGEARFTVGGEEVPAPAGTLLFIADPGLERVAVAERDGTVVLAVGAERGRAFEVSTWETRSLADARGAGG